MIRDQKKAVLGATVREIGEQGHGTKLVESTVHDLGAMDSNQDFVDGMLKTYRSKCSRLIRWFIGFTEHMKPSSGPVFWRGASRVNP